MRSILGTTVTSSLNSEKRKNQERPRKLAMSASMKAPSEPNAGVKKAVTFHSKTVIVEPSNRTAVPCTSMVPLKSAFKSSGTPPDLIKIDLTNSADRSDSDTEQSVVPTVVETAAKPVQQTDRRDENDQSEVWHVDSTEDKPPPPPPNVPRYPPHVIGHYTLSSYTLYCSIVLFRHKENLLRIKILHTRGMHTMIINYLCYFFTVTTL